MHSKDSRNYRSLSGMNPSRRDFLKLMGKAGGAFLALPLISSSAAGAASGTIKPGRVVVRTPERIILRNGLITDGTGKKAYLGNLLIEESIIKEISRGDIRTEARELDCTNKVISPGFIDMHSHMDWYLPINGCSELKTPFTAQGITTFVAGNCGYGVAAFKKDSSYRDMLEVRTGGLFELKWNTMEEYFSHLHKNGMSHNLLNLAGHGMTRTSIRGFDATPLNSDEMKEMLYLLEEAMDQGACGVSFGLQYEPGVFASLDEISQIAELVKKKDKILTVHLKAYSSLSGTYPLKVFGTPHNLLAIRDMLDIARQTGVRLQISHLIFVGSRTWKNYEQALSMIDEAIKQGVDVKFDTYSYHCGTSIINVFMPEWFLARVPGVYEDKSAMRKLRIEAALILRLLGFGFEDIQITYAKHDELNQFNGMFLSDIAKARGISGFENFVDFARRSGGVARVLNHKYSNPEIVEALIRHPASLFMTDASPASQGVQNPACYGNFPRFFQWIRDKNLISLEDAVYKCSGSSRQRFKINDRGILQKGLAADITVFDYNSIRDNNTVTETDKTPSGIAAVFINGKQVVSESDVDGSINAGVVVT
ncbi:MAG: amidohydrolase family protein [Deltaproteobacteria bacterium]|nr:amidohydrolase family protein [Deltaproteobacteria bacterium]